MNTSDILNKAADLIEERGWACGSGWFPRGSDPLCAEGAIKAAAGVGDHRRAIAAVEAYLELPRRVKFHNRPEGEGWPTAYLWVWNDIAPSSAADVVEVLRATALIEAARESEQVEQHAAMSAAVVA